MFVFDTETRTDPTQSLMFGSYRFIQQGHCAQEAIFYASDILPAEYAVLEKYVSDNNRNSSSPVMPKLELITRAEFVERLFQAAYKGRCLLVGFNLSFDLSRVAVEVTTARGRFAGGFSLGLSSYTDKQGRERRNQFRPRIGIKHIDSKRALRGFTTRNQPDREDLIPDDSETGIPEMGFTFRGHFLDLRTLAFALTDRGYSLETACKAFGVKNGKIKVTAHGVLTEDYIDYNRRDVQATCELAMKLLEEYDRHPVALQCTKAYSPASIGKSYLRGMGIKPVLERQPDFPEHLLGHAQSAFFGGRTSAHARKFAVPVVYTDFLSMYPTVNSLMGLWRFVTAEEIVFVEHCTTEIKDFLQSIRADNLFIPDTWKNLTAFVKVIPQGDILPNRAKYSSDSNDWQVALNYLYANKNETTPQGLWFSLPDVIASVLLTGRIPEIIDAFCIEPKGVIPDLKQIRLRGKIEIDPARTDFFKAAIEERKGLSKHSDLSKAEKDRLDKALKVLANSASYGIYAEMNSQESDDKVRVTCHGIDKEPYQCTVAHPDVPGEYCFPPLSSLITGAARLMLALLEYSVTELGGTYAMEDTDSMAIVASRSGGIVSCPGGKLLTPDGSAGVKALAWKQVKSIVDRFEWLNPYDRAVVPGSVLKIEDVNFDPNSGKQRQIYCFAISAKRYALFLLDKLGEPQLLRKGLNSQSNGWKEHGLGHLLNPTDPDSDDREWTAEIWLDMIRRALDLPTSPISFAQLPAIGRVTVSSPAVMRALADCNAGKPYRNQIKPFNFLLTAQTIPFGCPTDADPARFHLIGPFETNSRKWLRLGWIDQYSGKAYQVTTDGHTGSRKTARVKTYGDVVAEYEYHPESKCADADGNVCGKQTVGLLQRRHAAIDRVIYIGKESNRLEEVESGMVHDADSAYIEYPDPRRDEWKAKILPALKKMPLTELVEKTGMSRRALIDVRAGRSRPHPRNQNLLKQCLRPANTTPSSDALRFGSASTRNLQSIKKRAIVAKTLGVRLANSFADNTH
jgi:hypothetical protein